MSPQRVGDTVKVRGETWKITEIHGLSHLGSKFFGKCRFMLADADGRNARVYGKRIAANSRLTLTED